MNEEEDKARADAIGWLAHPLLSVSLAAVWLLLQQSLALPQLLVAALLGLVVPRWLHGFLPKGLRLRSVPAALRLFGVVMS
ncbi:MAG: Na+/H+ antiporter subunit E, partial [Hydrogenophaga sp.]